MLTFLMLLGRERRHLREIARRTDLPTMSVQRELARFGKLGLVRWENEGGQKYFSVNTDHPLYPDLRRLVLKTSGLVEPLREALSEFDGIKAAVVFGSIAAGTAAPTSDIDLLVVGKADELELHRATEAVETTLGRRINYVLMSLSELRRRRKLREPFLTRVLAGPIIPVTGDVNAL